MTYSSICQCVQYAAIEPPGTAFGCAGGIEHISSRHAASAYISSLEMSVQEYGTHAPSIIAPMADEVYHTVDAISYALTPDYSTGRIIARKDHFDPGVLLRQDRPAAPFVGAASVVGRYVRELFLHVTGREMGPDVTIEIVPKDELRRAHEAFGGAWSEGIQGFCVNKKGQGQSVIMVREGALDAVLLTIGHEIGHSRSIPLRSKLDEEAKAFAFQIDWARAIVENNVAGLAKSIDLAPRPARNGLHNVACLFVERERHKGLKALDIFTKLISGDLRVAG